jgi:2-polyprenyl-3-methyl-5-hydroxy-6-metoxy-1,4-benzoquinol methylase
MVPQGTHSWNKFIRPSDLITLFEKSKNMSFFSFHSIFFFSLDGFSVLLNNGMFYNPITNRWSWSENQAINYALCATKT